LNLDNVQNNGGFTWTIGQSDNINASLLAVNPKMVFQLNDANGADGFTLDSRGFLVLAQNSTSASPSTSPTASSTASPPAQSPAPSGGSGLSTAAKVGIGVGVPLAVLLGIILFVIGMCLGRRRKGKQDMTGNATGPVEQRNAHAQPVYDAYGTANRNTVSSMGSLPHEVMHELPSK
jgi:hypothetical protein